MISATGSSAPEVRKTAELDDLAGRLKAARERLRGLPVSDSHDLGPPDPKSGERWNRFNVLGHTAEMLAFWPGQIRRALDTGAKMGREPGSAARLEGIESGRRLGEEALRERIDIATDGVLTLVADLRPEDLDREIDSYGQGPITVRHALEHYLVGHLESHLAQLEQLP